MSTPKKRVQLIDALRGFSLAGIVLANILAFQYGVFGQSTPQLFGIVGAERALHSLLLITVVGSFMPIFAFMFGFGMIKLSESLQSRELRPKCHLARRFLMLFVIGMLHMTFLWEGDILMFYGVLGFFLLMFLNRKPRTLLIWAVLLLAGSGLFGLLAFNPLDPLAHTPSTHMENYILQSKDVYGSGSYAEIRNFMNNADPFGGDFDETLALLILVSVPLLLVPMFLLGMRAARVGTFDDPEAMRHTYLRRAVILIPVSLLLKAYGVLAPQLSVGGWPGMGIGGALGGTLLALGYIYAFAWLYVGRSHARLISRFEAVGRLSLTNYLMQSVICTMIFYGYGLGLFGRAGVFIGAVIALAVYGFQLWFSPLYLKKFSNGPFEHVLRIWTYLSWKGQPKKKRRTQQMTTENAPGVN